MTPGTHNAHKWGIATGMPPTPFSITPNPPLRRQNESLTEDKTDREEALTQPLVAFYDMHGEQRQWAYSYTSPLMEKSPVPTRGVKIK